MVDSPLLECHLPRGANEYELVESAEAVVLRSAASGLRTPVRIVSVRGLPAFLQSVSTDVQALTGHLPSQLAARD